MNTQDIGFLILKKRKAKNLTQQEVAERLHVSPTTVSKWENGKARPDYEKLKNLSDLLEIPFSELLGSESADLEPEKPEPHPPDALPIPEDAEIIPEIQPTEELPVKRRHLKRNSAIAALIAIFLCVSLVGITIFFHTAEPAVSDNFDDMEVFKHFHGEYHGLDACCLVIKCDKNIPEDFYASYEETIRETYNSCFEQTEAIVIFYLQDYPENNNYYDSSHRISMLFPVPNFEEMYGDIYSETQ